MRLWTLHPKYLDPQGLVALWREALLARAVLRGETQSYRHHPQISRFQSYATPRSAINAYLAIVLLEAESRGYAFNRSKIGPVRGQIQIIATTGQINYEWQHLLRKLKARSAQYYRLWSGITTPEANPVFTIEVGLIASWERAR
jgi:hypothetical protein